MGKKKKKSLMLGKTEGRRRRWQQRMRQLNGIIISMDVSLSKNGESGVLYIAHEVAKSQTRLSG